MNLIIYRFLVPQDALRSCGKAQFKSQNCTLCLIKPHVMKSQTTGELLTAIASTGALLINAVFSIHMSLAMGVELFEVYRGLYHTYTAMLEHMCSTPVLAVLVTGTGAARSSGLVCPVAPITWMKWMIIGRGTVLMRATAPERERGKRREESYKRNMNLILQQ